MIRHRVTIASLVGIALVFVLAGVATVHNLESRLQGDVDRRLEGFSTGFERVVGLRAGFVGPAPPSAPNPLDVRELLVVRLDEHGELVTALATGPASDPDPLPDVGQLEPDTDPHTVRGDDGTEYRAVAISGPGSDMTVVGLSLTAAHATVAQAQRVLVTAGVAALLAAAVVIWLVMRRGLRPVTSMIRTAERIADGDLHERAQIVHAADEVGHLGQALNTMLDRLTEAIDAKTSSEALMRRFAADASHELRTPLTSIRGYAELYRKGGGDLGRETAIQRIEHEATRMGSLVDDLLLLARLDQGRPLSREPVDINTIVADAVDAARVRTSAPIDLDLPAHPATARGDGPRLRQVIDNALANVATHAGPDATAHVSVAHNDGRITVIIRDDGVGMSPDVLDHALSRFWQADPDHTDAGGTGLGLAIANEIVRAHDGAISLASEPGKGTAVTIDIPTHGNHPDPL